METLHPSCHCSHRVPRLFLSSPPVTSPAFDQQIAVCHVGQQGSVAGLRLTKWAGSYVEREGGSDGEVGKKITFFKLMLRSTAGGSRMVEILNCACNFRL